MIVNLGRRRGVTPWRSRIPSESWHSSGSPCILTVWAVCRASAISGSPSPWCSDSSLRVEHSNRSSTTTRTSSAQTSLPPSTTRPPSSTRGKFRSRASREGRARFAYILVTFVWSSVSTHETAGRCEPLTTGCGGAGRRRLRSTACQGRRPARRGRSRDLRLRSDSWARARYGRHGLRDATALRRSATPSVILLRAVAELSPDDHAALLVANVSNVVEELEQGAIVSLSPNRLRVRRLPMR